MSHSDDRQRSPRTPEDRQAWLMLIVLVGMVGLIVWQFFGLLWR